MAVTILSPAKSGRRVMGKILQRLARGSAETTDINKKSTLNYSRWIRRMWVIADADPIVSPASAAVAPVKLGELAYREDTDEAFICSVAPVLDATSAVFIQLHA